ncbi:hypothetical protein HPB51_014967 [Rhipicephalus microplus]|uniref:Rab-GAP TBC domain-containing protein n=1 Tax=Rhipicephalus microplus TaxID=6941 RepID=A0A9J6E180_RHIMP|nr:hypothetical protein HPB51_014967 [Rhipicephalus microplus]
MTLPSCFQAEFVDSTKLMKPIPSSPTPVTKAYDDVFRFIQQGKIKEAKAIVRTQHWPIDHLHRGYLWLRLCQGHVKMAIPEGFYERTVKESLDGLCPISMPAFTDPIFGEDYLLSDEGQRRAERVLYVASVNYPFITYCPILHPLVCLLLHYLTEEQTYECACALVEGTVVRHLEPNAAHVRHVGPYAHEADQEPSEEDVQQATAQDTAGGGPGEDISDVAAVDLPRIALLPPGAHHGLFSNRGSEGTLPRCHGHPHPVRPGPLDSRTLRRRRDGRGRRLLGPGHSVPQGHAVQCGLLPQDGLRHTGCQREGAQRSAAQVRGVREVARGQATGRLAVSRHRHHERPTRGQLVRTARQEEPLRLALPPGGRRAAARRLPLGDSQPRTGARRRPGVLFWTLSNSRRIVRFRHWLMLIGQSELLRPL